MSKIEIFVCYHKPYRVFISDILRPIHVGKACSQLELEFDGDASADNISRKNPFFCELTATYWIWKNAQADIVGLFHYRRYLNFSNDHTQCFYPDMDDQNFCTRFCITKAQVEKLLEQADVIVPAKDYPHGDNVFDAYAREHVGGDLGLVLDIIREKYGEEALVVAEQVLRHGKFMYPANVLIASKAIFDLYAAWLFEILFELEKRIQIEVLNRNPYQQRVYGFLGERLTAVFLACHPELRVIERPLLFIQEDQKQFEHYLRKRKKRKVLDIICRALFRKDYVSFRRGE